MALSATQVANAAAYYAGQNRAVSNLIRNAPANVAALAAGGSISRIGTPIAPVKAPKLSTPSTSGLDNVQQAQVNLGVRKAGDKNPILAFQDYLQQRTNPVYGFANAALAPEGKDQAPTNAAQWVMNLLSGGLYASARGAQGAVKGAQALGSAEGKVLSGKGNIGDILGALGLGASQEIGGVARGLAEGVGARFDDERPRTFGQNFEDWGATKAVEDAAGGLGATDTGSHFFDNKNTYGGLLGFAGDVLLDPSTYIAGTGLLKGAGTALREGSDAARAGAGLIDTLKAGSQGLKSGVAEAAADRAAAAASKAQRAALLKGNQSAFVKAGGDPAAYERASGAVHDLAATLGDKPTTDEILPIPMKVADTPKGPSLLDRKAAVDALLPSIEGTSRRAVPAEEILRKAASPGERAMAPELGDALRAAAVEPTKVSDVRVAISQIAATKEGRNALAATLRVGGEDVSVKDAITTVATRRLTGGEGTVKAQAVQQALEQHLRQQTARPAVWNNPADMQNAITRLMPSAAPDAAKLNATSLEGATPLGNLVRDIQGAKSMTERKQILVDALGTQRTKYQTFDQAMLAATRGDIGDVAVMRQMLKALGIDTTMTDADAVRNALNGTGRAAWSDIQAAVRNQAEVLSDHGVSPVEARAVQLTNEIREAQQAQAAYRDVVRELGYDPAVVKPPRYNGDGTPNAGASIGNAIHHGIAALGAKLAGHQLSETFGRQAMLTLHQAIVKTLRLRGGGVTGASRGENFIDDYLAATVASENYYRTLGQIPHLPATAGRTPMYVSFGQVLAHLPREVAVNALFRPLKYRLGRTTGDAAYKAGLSIYPTTIAAGARAALQGGKDARSDLADLAMAAMAADGRRNAFQASQEGQDALAGLAEAMSSPEFVRAMTVLHDQQILVATRIAQKTAEGFVVPIGARIATALGNEAERGEITAAIRDGYTDVHNATRDLDGSVTLAHDLAVSRLDNAMVNGVLGEWGHALAAVDGRAATAAKAARKAGPQATRDAATGSTRRLLDDTEQMTEESVQDRVDIGDLEDTEVERLRTLGEFYAELGQQSFFGKIGAGLGKVGVGVEGEYGKGDVFPLQMMVERGASASTSALHERLTNWFHSKGGVRTKLGQSLGLGRAASRSEANAAMQGWWHALATTLRHATNLPDGAVREALLRGTPADARAGIRDSIAGLDETQADMAMELLGHIRQVFQRDAGPLHRLGVTGTDIKPYLSRFGQGDHLADDTATALELADHWMDIDSEAPLNTLLGYRAALDHAGVRPMLGAGIQKLFGNPADWDLTTDAARAAGWRALDQSSGSLAKWIPKGTLLDPEIRRNLIFVQHALDEIDKNLPKFFSTVFAPIDALTAVIKPSMTIWRLGHHVSNMLGNGLFEVLHGYNPMGGLRSIQTLRLLPGMAEMDASAISRFDQTWMQNVADQVPGFTGALKPRATAQSATVVLRDGTVLDLQPEQLAQLAQRNGIVMTAHQAKDLAPERELTSVGGGWDRFVHSKLNVVAQANRKIANATTIYENISRLSVMIQALEKGTFRSLDEAIAHAAGEVQKTHPSREALSVFDRKYATRLILFHNWIRGAIGSVLRTAVERPKLVTLPSDWQYNQAEANGLEPESIGKPFNNDPRIASYYSQGLLGPTWLSGLSPFGGIDDLAGNVDANGQPQSDLPHQWGMSLSSPQMDALTNYFGGVNFGDDPLTNLRVLGGNLNPLVGAPLELLSNTQLGSETGQQIVDPSKGAWGPQYANWLWQQTGFPASVTSAFGLTNTHATWTDAENQGDVSRKLFNFLTGLKVVDYNNPTSTKIGTSEAGQQIRQELSNLGYTDAQVKAIQSYYNSTLP